MRILHVAETAKGGVGSYLDELIPLQAASLGSANIVAIIPLEDRDQLSSVGDKNLKLFHRRSRSLSALLEMRTLVKHMLQEFRPDIVHLHSTFAGAVGRLAIASRRGAKVIYNPHGWAFEMWPKGAKRRAAVLAERLMTWRCDRIVAVCETERRQGISVGFPPEKIEVAVNGISADPSRSPIARWNDERLKVLFVGRLDRQKGIDTLASIASRNVDTLAVRVIGDQVVGDTNDRVVAPNIEYLGWLDRTGVDAQMQACDVVAMPSRWEGLSITALEAMRAAKPVIAFSVGGLGEAIADGVTGRLIPAGDIAAFERALLFETLELWPQMGASARRRFDQLFTAERMADRIAEIYAQVCGPSDLS